MYGHSYICIAPLRTSFERQTLWPAKHTTEDYIQRISEDYIQKVKKQISIHPLSAVPRQRQYLRHTVNASGATCCDCIIAAADNGHVDISVRRLSFIYVVHRAAQGVLKSPLMHVDEQHVKKSITIVPSKVPYSILANLL
jgi:hypothetical protein